MFKEFFVSTNGAGLYEFTADVAQFCASIGAVDGLLSLMIQHTSASLLIQENADPDVQSDLQNFFHRLVPPSTEPEMSYLIHTYEGPDDMPAHIKAAMMPTTLSIPVRKGRMTLGTWQGIYVFEHRNAPHRRRIAAYLLQ